MPLLATSHPPAPPPSHLALVRGMPGPEPRSTGRGTGREAGVTPDLDALFGEASALVHRTAYRITGRAEDADDVLQSVFLALVQSSRPWPDQPAAWLHRSAVNASLDILRRRARWGEHAIPDGHAEAAESTEDRVAGALDAQALEARLRAALPGLSSLEAEVFSLRVLEDRPTAEVAALLGKSPNHVAVTLHAARQKLRDALAT